MKSPGAQHMGNVNMKGKKVRLLRCGCCDCVDFREDYDKKMAQKEIRDAFKGDKH